MRRVVSPGVADEKGTLVCFVSYNIRNIRNGGLDSTLHRMSQANMGLGVFQDM